MMRISRFQLILIVAVVALLGVNVFLAIGYFSAVSRKASLQSEIDIKERAIAAMPTDADISHLQNQKAAAEQRLREEALIPAEIDPLEPHIIDVMQRAGIDFYNFNPGKEGQEKIGGGTYTAHTYSITDVTERLSELIDFLELIEELPYDTLYIRNVKFTSIGEVWTLQFNLVIITQ